MPRVNTISVIECLLSDIYSFLSAMLIYTILDLMFSISMCGDFPLQSRLGVYRELGPMSIEVKSI